MRQATGLTRSLLAYARRETIAPTLLSVDELVTSALPLVRQIVGADLELSVALDTPAERVVIDGTQLRQVLLNLVGNAVDATRGFGRHVRVSTGLVVLEADQARDRGLVTEGTFLVLTVADDGRGMSRDLQERAFDPFFTTKTTGEGTGLGLAMCTSIVRRAGGFISIDSLPDRGATLRVHLPIARTRGDGAAAAPPRRAAISRRPRSRRSSRRASWSSRATNRRATSSRACCRAKGSRSSTPPTSRGRARRWPAAASICC